MATANKSDLVITRVSDTELRLTREFDAPRELVFKAMTDPTLVSRWWGPRKYRTVVDEMDARPGGKWRMRNIAADGGEHAAPVVARGHADIEVDDHPQAVLDQQPGQHPQADPAQQDRPGGRCPIRGLPGARRAEHCGRRPS